MAEGTESRPEPPDIEEARGWIGSELDDVDGREVGRVRGLFVDAESGAPAWLVVALERRGLLPIRRRVVLIAVPARDCAGGAGRVWTAHHRRALHSAPVVDPERPLLREHEITICAHYEIGPTVGRAAEVVERPEAAVTCRATPA